ncbi:DUF2721 domain-containing protein [Anaeromyxobacter oryzae]|uniref:DUF2721 domain-containing protein n=1 Tax=Anaeromyxobacter oryzae TaxID=2918170 RepID=A0ABM7X322_9BACT|nr:DUF2721 domain-containing protein [Anaeromyxobacter oryzae]BDG06191.1 hypothetical protein AMOR_51870 [Anaeromyxobacter oryzae]
MNALQQIGAAVTPAVMVSACGLVALGLDNQTARMAMRLRELAREWRELPAASPRRATVRRQIAVLDRRHGLYSRALLLNYGALFAFVVTSLLWLGQAYWAVPSEIPLATFGLGVAMLAAMSVLVIASVTLARNTIQSEAAEILADATGRPPAETPGNEPAAAHGR